MIAVEDPNGEILEQAVMYEWTPPFCQKCQVVGHDCAKKQPAPKPKTKKQWIPKSKPA